MDCPSLLCFGFAAEASQVRQTAAGAHRDVQTAGAVERGGDEAPLMVALKKQPLTEDDRGSNEVPFVAALKKQPLTKEEQAIAADQTFVEKSMDAQISASGKAKKSIASFVLRCRSGITSNDV